MVGYEDKKHDEEADEWNHEPLHGFCFDFPSKDHFPKRKDNMPAIENRDRQKIHDPEIEANKADPEKRFFNAVKPAVLDDSHDADGTAEIFGA